MSNNYCPAPLLFETNNQRNQRNDFTEMSNNTNISYSELVAANDSVKPAIYMGDGWCTFPDLDNFDSDKLLRAFTLKEKDSADSIWDPTLSYSDSCQHTGLSISALRQLEALFNLSQLLFGLSRAETVNYTFRDLQLRRHPHSFKKSGFKQLNTEGRIDFYSIFEKLVTDIIDAGGLEVTLLIYKNPMLPMVRQKCLDLISNVSTVPDVAYKIMRHQMWFLDHLLILVRDGEIVSDKIPALSVLIRLLKVMLTERMITAYMKLVDMQYIDSLVDIFENPEYTESTELLPFFIKFEFITMQSLTVILGDAEYSQLWSDKAKTRLLNYCMIVLLKASGAYPTIINNEQIEQINHIFYAEQHTNKHSLAHTIMTVTELLRNDENMKLFYRYHRPFKQLIIQLYKKYGAKSLYIRTDPGISYALNHLMRVLYIKNSMPVTNSTSSGVLSGSSLAKTQKQQSSKNLTSKKKLNEIESQQPRTCSNTECKNEETKYKPFKQCLNCQGNAAYCSSKCRKAHIAYHLKNECRRDDLQLERIDSNKQPAYNRIYSSTSTGNYQKNPTNRRASDNLQHKNYQEITQQTQQIPSTNKRRESSAGQELFYQSTTTKKLSKFSSMNENHRRNSVASNMPFQEFENICPATDETNNLNRINPVTKNVYAKRSSMKESKSGIGSVLRRFSAFEDSTNSKQITKVTMDDTTNSVQFVRPLKTSTALCLTDLTRRQSLRDEQTNFKKEFTKDPVKKNDSSYGSSLSSDSASVKSNKNLPGKKIKTDPDDVIKRIKTPSNDETDLDNSVHKRRHSATAAILTSISKSIPKAFDDSVKLKSFPINDSLFYHGKQEPNDYNQTKSSSSSKDKQKIEHTSDDDDDFLSSTDSSSDSQQVKVQKYKSNLDCDDEVETNRWAVNNEQNLGCSNERIESKLHSDIHQKDNMNNDFYSSTVSNINEDDQDLRSHFKVVKEFEKTLEFVKNASNLKVMPSLSLNQNNNDEETVYHKQISGLKAPQISLASLCYDTSHKHEPEDEDEESDDSDEDDSDDTSDSEDKNDQMTQQVQQMGRNLRGVNLIINNSIDSHMLTNSYSLRDPMQINELITRKNNEINNKKLSYHDIKQKSTKTGNKNEKHYINRVNSNNHLIDNKTEVNKEDDEFIDDELSMFKNDTLQTNKFSDYHTFKKPLIYLGNETKSTSSLYSTKQQVSEFKVRQASFELKNRNAQVYVQKHNELKVFDNLSVNDNNPVKLPELPKNSTPIFTDNATAATLNAKHRQFLNAKLNLTIIPPHNQLKQESKPVFLVPQIPPVQYSSDNKKQSPANIYKTSTLKSNSNLIMESVDQFNADSRKMSHKILASDILDVSKISALENATSTNSCVVVTKAEMPRDIKKCLKDEIKKDKSKCSIQ